jgi:hypothetical protein
MSARQPILLRSDPRVGLPSPCDTVEFEGIHTLQTDGRLVRKRTINFGSLLNGERAAFSLSLRRTVPAELAAAVGLGLAAGIAIRILPIIDALEAFEARVLLSLHQVSRTDPGPMSAEFYISLSVNKANEVAPFVSCWVSDGRIGPSTRIWRSGDPDSDDRTPIAESPDGGPLGRAPRRIVLAQEAAHYDEAAATMIEEIVECLSEIAEQLP